MVVIIQNAILWNMMPFSLRSLKMFVSFYHTVESHFRRVYFSRLFWLISKYQELALCIAKGFLDASLLPGICSLD